MGTNRRKLLYGTEILLDTHQGCTVSQSRLHVMARWSGSTASDSSRGIVAKMRGGDTNTKICYRKTAIIQSAMTEGPTVPRPRTELSAVLGGNSLQSFYDCGGGSRTVPPISNTVGSLQDWRDGSWANPLVDV